MGGAGGRLIGSPGCEEGGEEEEEEMEEGCVVRDQLSRGK